MKGPASTHHSLPDCTLLPEATQSAANTTHHASAGHLKPGTVQPGRHAEQSHTSQPTPGAASLSCGTTSQLLSSNGDADSMKICTSHPDFNKLQAGLPGHALHAAAQLCEQWRSNCNANNTSNHSLHTVVLCMLLQACLQSSSRAVQKSIHTGDTVACSNGEPRLDIHDATRAAQTLHPDMQNITRMILAPASRALSFPTAWQCCHVPGPLPKYVRRRADLFSAKDTVERPMPHHAHCLLAVLQATALDPHTLKP